MYSNLSTTEPTPTAVQHRAAAGHGCGSALLALEASLPTEEEFGVASLNDEWS
ncbi:conserved hypothetical protein [Culex quinquefasciatus]|uniref:Uncharacterized protein n=1 Tax=Culex quinquefasciatus TaxID=7176 RepID=B0XG90_CULQU|nr:conserved hypothetical protein [Culex quinquefasciatus]|eukprot:XP_001868662.1 conserved hypothetical protein [Culex quinquefasciatus]